MAPSRSPGIVAVVVALLALLASGGGASAVEAPAPPPESPALAQSLAVQVAPVPEREPAEGDATVSPRTLEQLPLESRTNPLLYVGDHVPGVVAVDGGLSIHGGEARETALFIDDVRTSRLVLPLGMLERLEVLTAGYGATLADVSGGAVVATTRRESRSLSMDVGHAREMGRRSDDVTSVAVGTPLVRDRLFLRVAAELQFERWHSVSDFNGVLPDTPVPSQRTVRGAAKFIWLPAVGQRIELLGAGNFSRRDNSGALGFAKEAQPRYQSNDLALSARWAGALGKRLSGRVQLYGERNGQREQPLACVAAAECLTPPTVQIFPSRYQYGNWSRDSDVIQRALELVAAVEATLPETPWLRSSVRLTSRARAGDFSSTVSVPGNRLIQYQNTFPDREITYYANDPRIAEPEFGPVRDDASAMRAIQSLEAPMFLFSRVQLVPGLALVSARARTSGGDQLRLAALAPGLSASWQVLRRLPLFVRASTVSRVDADLDRVSLSTLSSPVSRSCRWNTQTNAFDQDCEYSGGNSGRSLGLPCSPAGLDGFGQPCRGDIHFPRSWENTVGFGLVPVEGLRADVDLVHRRGDSLWQVSETNRIWNQPGTPLMVNGAYRNGRSQTVTDLSTPPTVKRRHRSLHTTLTATPGPVALTLAHVHSRNHLPPSSTSVLPAGQSTTLFDDEGRHFVYGQAAADLRGYFSIGVLYAFAQGPPYSRRFYNDVTGRYEDYRAQVGTSPGANLNDPSDDKLLRLPSTQQLSLQVRARGRRLLGADVDIYLDMMQVLQNRNSGPSTTDGPFFGSAAPSGPTSWYRLGLQYRY